MVFIVINFFYCGAKKVNYNVYNTREVIYWCRLVNNQLLISLDSVLSLGGREQSFSSFTLSLSAGAGI